ncbi:hypothetical protein EG68_08981 [Paragonimus skrjabini miyazakii]|uniref:Uncharacterized protein n=1 Tax=Paragonimus skrjabini miyazakii TaxID=59628 RepID=A0A8S9YNU9_9TREM|nr:hypothetical protein EG68_08981 [Paragonimus skrjabini miyazakii]
MVRIDQQNNPKDVVVTCHSTNSSTRPSFRMKMTKSKLYYPLVQIINLNGDTTLAHLHGVTKRHTGLRITCFHESIQKTIKLTVPSVCKKAEISCNGSHCHASEASCYEQASCADASDELPEQCPAIHLDGRAFDGQTPANWSTKYLNKTSEDYKKLTLQICSTVDEALRKIQHMYMVPNTCILSKVYPGSVRVTLELRIRKKALNSAQAKYTMRELTDMITTQIHRINTTEHQFTFRDVSVPRVNAAASVVLSQGHLLLAVLVAYFKF